MRRVQTTDDCSDDSDDAGADDAGADDAIDAVLDGTADAAHIRTRIALRANQWWQGGARGLEATIAVLVTGAVGWSVLPHNSSPPNPPPLQQPSEEDAFALFFSSPSALRVTLGSYAPGPA